MEDSGTDKDTLVERVALRVALEAYPLREASIPPCRLRSIALSKGTKGGHLLLYLGTDTGQLLVFTISAATSSQVDAPANDSSSFTFSAGAPAELRDGQISPRQPSYSSELTRKSPDVILGIPATSFVDARPWASSPSFSSYLTATISSDVASVKSASVNLSSNHPGNGASSGPLTDSASYQFSPAPSPPLSIAPSLDDDIASRDDSFGLGLAGASSSVYLSEFEDSRIKAKEPEYNIVLRARKPISRGSVECLCVLPEAGRIAVLSDDLVALVDFKTLGSLEVLQPTKGASAIARCYQTESGADRGSGVADNGVSAPDNQDGQVHNDVDYFKRDVQLTEKWSTPGSLSSKFGDIKGVFGFSKVVGGQVGSGVTRMTRRPGAGSARLAVAVKKKLLLFEVYARTERKEKTSARLLKEMVGMEGVVTLAWLGNVLFAGSVREYTIFSLSTGQATPLFSLPQDSPGPPLLKPFPEDNGVLLTVDKLGIVVDTNGIARTDSVVFNAVPDAVASSAPFVVAATHGHVELYHRRTGRKVQTLLTDVREGPSILADSDDGNFLVVANASKIWCFLQASVDDQVKELLKQKDYREAVQVAKECVESNGGDSAIKRLGVVHVEAGFLLIFDLCFEEAIDQLLEANVLQPFELFPFFPTLTSRWRSVTPRKRYWGLHPPPQPIEKIIDSGLKELQSALYGHESTTRSKVLLVKDAVGRREEAIMLAIKSFVRYFSIIRQRPLSTEEKEGVDTILMKLYIQLGSSVDLEQLACSPNSCILEEVEGVLKRSAQLQALAMLYENKGLILLALQVWQSLAIGDVPDSSFHTPGEETHNRSKDSVSSQTSVRIEPASQAARLLEMSRDSDLVLEHIIWILQLSEDLAFHVLTSPKRDAPLPAEKVLALLQVEDGSLRRRYLQWLVQDQGSHESHHHTELALSLARAALRNLKHTSGDSDTSSSSPEGLGESDAVHLRQVLQSFLESSNKYAPEVLLQEIQNTELWHEQVTLHQKLGDEISALRILALNLEDYQAAEQYCVELGRPDAYMQLLDIYLKPGPGKEPLHRAAVRLIHRQCLTLDPLRILEAISSDMPLCAVSQTITCMLRARVHWHLQGQVLRHLVRAGNLEARVLRVEELSRHVQITMDSTCSSCHARIGTKPFGLNPNDSVICYKTQWRALMDSTKTGHRHIGTIVPNKFLPILENMSNNASTFSPCRRLSSLLRRSNLISSSQTRQLFCRPWQLIVIQRIYSKYLRLD